MFFPSGDHSSPSASVAMFVNLCLAVTVPVAPSKSAIQICDPFSLVETNDLSFTAGVPHVSLILGNVGIVVLIATKRHHPDVWRLRVRLQINIDSGKQDPFTVRRGNRFLNALERHHVFKGEGMFVLSNGGERARKHKNR